LSGEHREGGDLSELPKLKVEWRVNILAAVVALLGLVSGGAAVYGQVIGTNAEVGKLRTTDLPALQAIVSAQGADADDINGRVIRLETRMDVIIDQNRQILAELRGGSANP
jgi:hypothetical protein